MARTRRRRRSITDPVTGGGLTEVTGPGASTKGGLFQNDAGDFAYNQEPDQYINALISMLPGYNTVHQNEDYENYRRGQIANTINNQYGAAVGGYDSRLTISDFLDRAYGTSFGGGAAGTGGRDGGRAGPRRRRNDRQLGQADSTLGATGNTFNPGTLGADVKSFEDWSVNQNPLGYYGATLDTTDMSKSFEQTRRASGQDAVDRYVLYASQHPNQDFDDWMNGVVTPEGTGAGFDPSMFATTGGGGGGGGQRGGDGTPRKRRRRR
jgi:hypothetical protein